MRHPFGKNFDIESYNTSWFDDKPVSRPPDFLLDNTFFENSAKKVKPLSETGENKSLIIPAESNEVGGDFETGIVVNPTEELLQIKYGSGIEEKMAIDSNTSNAILTSNIDKSNDKLLFVRFTPANTLRPRWFLVQIVQQESDETPLPLGVYFCSFFQKHPSDKNKSDDKSRW